MGAVNKQYLVKDKKLYGSIFWIKILKELYKAGYTGPFMYEVKTSEYKEFKDLYNCYQNLYQNFIDSNK